MVFKNKNAFTFVLSLIIVPTSLVQASESLESALSRKLKTTEATPSNIPAKENESEHRSTFITEQLKALTLALPENLTKEESENHKPLPLVQFTITDKDK